MGEDGGLCESPSNENSEKVAEEVDDVGDREGNG